MSKIYLAERAAVQWTYYATLTLDGWTQIDENNAENGFTQTATCDIVEKNGIPITESTQLSIPMAKGENDFDENDAIREALNLVCDGIVISGEGTVTVKVRQKPEREITVYWYGR